MVLGSAVLLILVSLRFLPDDMLTNLPHLEEALTSARQSLLAERTEAGHWEGELSSSALSTATALFALALYCRAGGGRADAMPLVHAGIAWLIEHQNTDGGWGDTVRSRSNISTTALCWAALSVAGDGAAGAVSAAEGWLTRAAGSLEPGSLAKTIADRYGKDRTFSVPILTMCALAGRLGKGREGWRHVPGLPFELAACPRQWFAWMRLPVVSYALPALIAIGQVGHFHRPSLNPLARLVRTLARDRTLGVLREIQPRGGGFLEATPLTSFVLMSLVGAGNVQHPVVAEGVDFLIRSARPDGSWPIDTNLATWLTTLSVNALAAADGACTSLAGEEQDRVREWLLGQQYPAIHPYTLAAPGAWAWTDLPGGVPDADDTAGALLALGHLGADDARTRAAAAAGVRWLLDLQNRDGGMPTFCRGWGALPFDRSGADLTAHALQAWDMWKGRLPADVEARLPAATEHALRYLAATQRADGAWVPLWFGNEAAADDENPVYGTARVLPALFALDSQAFPIVAGIRELGLRWLLAVRNPDGGWGGDSGVPSSIEETALAVLALAGAAPYSADADLFDAVAAGARWLVERTERGSRFEPSPIGFYFARLWYYERLYPLIFTAAAWSAAVKVLRDDVMPGIELSGTATFRSE